MICLLVSYPWQIICHLATELKRELKELWTNSRLGLLEWFYFRQIHSWIVLQNCWFLKLVLPRYCSKHYSMWKPNLEHVPRNLPLQIFLLQLQLCNMRLKMVDHLQGHKITHKMIEKNRALNICWNLNLLVKLTRSLHHLSLLRNPYPHQFHLENQIQNLEDGGQPWTGQFKVGLPPVPSGVRRTLCQPWPHPGYRCKARIWNCILKLKTKN